MNNLPLYGSAHSCQSTWGKCPLKANKGLWFDKFFHHWANGFASLTKAQKGEGKDGKHKWIAEAVSKPCGDKELITEHVQRQARLVEAVSGEVLTLMNESRFVTGMGREHPVENGFSWHHVLGTPFIPGSTLKGVARAWAEHWDKNDRVNDLFGSGKSVGRVAILDMLPVGPVRLCGEIMTPHYDPYYQGDEPPADWHDPIPIPFLAVEAGQKFQMAVIPSGSGANANDDVAETVKIIVETLDWLGAGAKTGSGMGRFRLSTRTVSAPQKPPLDEFRDWFESQPDLKAQKNRHGEIVAKFEALGDQESITEYLKTKFKKKECTPKLKKILWG